LSHCCIAGVVGKIAEKQLIYSQIKQSGFYTGRPKTKSMCTNQMIFIPFRIIILNLAPSPSPHNELRGIRRLEVGRHAKREKRRSECRKTM